ncbi:ADP-ribosyltransferase [Candidatus Berkiella cookevillensis]|uniref:ADP-ribosyltransferase n=1 Tax=Candidatus Berkiella cookevillensis TaxID=437022 RepID=A0A0Q9YDC4_9GAMM|nr:ADP-ribosyltransferase domain-containing protein [Candidatus Berkiella cookevillensis]MCS5707904.1 ADP-ribosyltransferase [Candidatus Berkiella cookevillensis]
MSELKYGPLNKDLHTQMYELIVKCILEIPNSVQHSIESDKHGKDALFTHIGNASINLSELTQKINFNHLSFNQNDSYHFEQSYSPYFFNREFGNGHHNQYSSLSYAEKLAIYNYTGSYYHDINSFLHGKVDSLHYAWDYCCAHPTNLNDTANELILNMGFLASGLNKIMPETDHHSHTYRGEHSPSHDEIQMRIQLAQIEDGITHEPAFMSTSLNSYISEGFSSGSLIIFDHTYGKNITGLSQFEGEEEYLILPGHILWEAYDYHYGTFRFQAKVVTPLLDDANTLSENELIQFKNLIDFAEQNYIKIDFLTDFNQEKLTHSLKEVSLKTVVDNHTICFDEVLSCVSDNNILDGTLDTLPLSYAHSSVSELFSQTSALLEVF